MNYKQENIMQCNYRQNKEKGVAILGSYQVVLFILYIVGGRQRI